MSSMQRVVDLSHRFTPGMQTYPGFPVPVVAHVVPYADSTAWVAEGQQFVIEHVTFTAGSGTYLDSPRHFYPGRDDIASVPLEGLVDLPVVVVDAPSGRREYLASDFEGYDLAGRAVLLRTGHSTSWGTPEYITGSPFVGRSAAEHLRDERVALVGIDALLVDDVDEPGRADRVAHVTLLGAGIPLVENMTGLDQLPAQGARLTAAPVAFEGVGSFPVRAFAVVD